MCNNCAGKVLTFSLVAINIILMLIGLSILGFSIYAAIDSPSAIRLLSDHSSYFVEDRIGLTLGRIFFWVAVGFAILSFVAIIISITGIIGTLKGSKPFVLVNFIFVLILLLALIAGALVVYFQNFQFVHVELENGLKNYKNARNATESEDIFTATWDDLQIQFTCCGVNGYKDWTNRTIIPIAQFPDEKKRLVPASCCSTLVDSRMQLECGFFPQEERFADRMGGCFDQIQKLFQTHKETIGIVMGAICGFFFLNLTLIFLFSLFVGEEHFYSPVPTRY